MTFVIILAAAMITFSLVSIAEGLGKVASAIEARRAETSGSVGDESAVPKADAQQ